MNPESILDIYRRAWMLLSMIEKMNVIQALNEIDETPKAGQMLMADFADWCRTSDDKDNSMYPLAIEKCFLCGVEIMEEEAEIIGLKFCCKECLAVKRSRL